MGTKISTARVIINLFQVNHIKELPSYDDLNFYITTSENVANEHISETNADGYVFKILNSLQSSTPVLIGE